MTGSPLAPLFSQPVTRNERLWATGLDAYPTSLGEVLSATAEDTWIRNPGPSLMRMLGRGRYDETVTDELGNQIPNPVRREATILSRDDANDRYGIKGELKFDADTPEPVAAELNALKREELARKDTIARGSGGFGAAAAQLGVGLAVSIVDPINVGSAFIPVVGEARFAMWAERFGTPLARLAKGTIEGAAGAAMVEPIVLGAARQEQADYGAADSFLNIVFGAAIGGGLHVGVGALADRFGSAPLEKRETHLRAAVGDLVETGTTDRTAPILARDLGAAYDRVLADPAGDPRQVLAAIDAEDLGQVLVRHGAFKNFNEVEFSKQGYGLVKVIWAHGEKSGEAPAFRVARDDVMALPDIVRDFDPIPAGAEPSSVHRTWVVERADPETGALRKVIYGTKQFGAADEGRTVVTIHVEKPGGRSLPLSAEKGSAQNGSGGASVPPGSLGADTKPPLPGATAGEAPPAAENVAQARGRGKSGPYIDVPAEPDSLIPAIIRAGGIADARGDFTVDRKAWKALLAKKGKGQTLDMLAIRMREAKFLEGARGDTPEEKLRWAIQEELDGRKQFATGDLERALERQAAMDINAEIDRLAADYGVDPKGLTREQFLARVAQSEQMTFERATLEAQRQADAIEAEYAAIADARKAFLEAKGEAWEPEIYLRADDPANPNWEIDHEANLGSGTPPGSRESDRGRAANAGDAGSAAGAEDRARTDPGAGNDGAGNGSDHAGEVARLDAKRFDDPELTEALAQAEADLDALLRAGVPADDPAVAAAEALVRDAQTQGRSLDAAAFCMARNP